MTLRLSDIFGEMVGDTERFLKHYEVMIAGNHFCSGETDAWFIDLDRTVPGFTRRGNPPRKQRPLVMFDVGLAQPYNYAQGGRMRVWNVRMQQLNDQAIDTHFALPRIGGPNVMMTSLLSACSFGVGMPSRGAQIVSHIQPPNRQAGTQNLNPALLDPTVTAGLTDGVAALFSRATEARYTDKATIIGIRRRGDWGFYAQTTEAANLAQEITGAFQFA